MLTKVTVLMAVYNGEKYLRESIDSILNQTFTNFEFLIINDGSTDKTLEILKSYSDLRIKIINNKENIGLIKSLNKGLKIAKGKYIARMDADDISEPERFEKQVEFLNTNPSIGVVGINSIVIDEEGNIVSKLARPISHNKIIAKILSENQMVHSSLMLRKNLLEKYGYYNEEAILVEDYELLLRLFTVTKLANLPNYLHQWRKNPTGISFSNRQIQITTRDRIRYDFLSKYYTLNKKYVDLVISNLLNNPKDIILSKYFNKILKDVSPMRTFFIKLNITLSNLRKPHLYIKKFLAIKKTIKKQIKHSGKIIRYLNNEDMCEITIAEYKKMLNNLVMDKVTEITFSGWGEPLLARDFLEIIDYTKKTYPDIKLCLYTNGIALSETIAQELIKHNFYTIVISINASIDKTYSKVMGIDLFNKTAENIKNLVLIRNKTKANLQIQLSFVASLLNIDDLPGLILLASDLGVDEVSMQYCRFYRRKIVPDSNSFAYILDKKYSLFFHKAHSDKMVKQSIRLAKSKKIKFRHEPLFCDPYPGKKRCLYPWTTILIGPQGEIYPCGGGELTFYKSVKEHSLYFGNLWEEHISKFWKNKDYRKLRQSCNYRNRNKSISQCWSCNYTVYWEGTNSEKSHFIDIDV